MDLVAYVNLLPLWYQYTLVAVFGLILGSFLNVCIYRFHTGRSVTGSSHCLSCGTLLHWYELIPVVSYIVLRGRCRSCGSFIPTQYALVEAGTALLFALWYVTFGLSWVTLLWWAISWVLVAVTAYDLKHFIIPDEFTAILVLLAVGERVLTATVPVFSWPFAIDMVSGGLAAFAVFALLWLVSRGRWIGFGDAKLALPMGLVLGLVPTFSFVVLSFWIGALISVLVLLGQRLLRRGQPHLRFLSTPLTMKSEVPFAPFLVASFLIVSLWRVDVVTLIAHFMMML